MSIKKPLLWSGFLLGGLFNHPSFFEGRECAVFGDGTETFGRDGDRDGLGDLRHINTLLLEVGILARRGDRVKFGRTNLGRVATRHL